MPLQEEMEKQGNWLFRYRGGLPFIILVIGAGIYLRTKVNPEEFFLEKTIWLTYYEFFCLGVSLLGLVIRAYTVGYTPANTSGRNVKQQLADSLNSTGIYSLVRHPLYLGNFFSWAGFALLTGNFWFVLVFSLIYWIYYERIMFSEEQFLRKKFGQQYVDWAKETPAFFPNFKNFKKSPLAFSWKKVLKKEKNTLASIFLLFAVFHVSGKLIVESFNFNWFFIVSGLTSLLIYFILRYLKKSTRVLHETGR